MAKDTCIGLIRDTLMEDGVEAVIQNWPELQSYKQVLTSAMRAELSRADHLDRAASDELTAELMFEKLEAQLS